MLNKIQRYEIEAEVELDLYEKLTNPDLLVRQKQDILQVIALVKISRALDKLVSAMEALEDR